MRVRYREGYDKTVLMDMHVHMLIETGPNEDSDSLKMSSQLKQMRGVKHAMDTLMAGFTTVRNAKVQVDTASSAISECTRCCI